MYDNTSVVPPAQKSQEDGEVAGLLDLTGDRGFLRADGYLPGPDDVRVERDLVRAHGLRRGDTVAGTARGGAPT